MTALTISIIVFLTLAVIGLILFVFLRKSDRDCSVKVYEEGTCVSGAYNIVYDTVASTYGKGRSCMDVIKNKNSRLTYAPITGTTRYRGTGTCSDCVLKDISYNDCSGNKQRLRLDVSSNAVDGQTCLALAKQKYNYDFLPDASGYYLDIECKNCDISTGSVREGSCLGSGSYARKEYMINSLNSTYGMDCRRKAIKDISAGSAYDASYNLVYYLVNCDITTTPINSPYLRYGYGSTNTNTKTSTDGNFKFYFDANSNLIGFDVKSSVGIGTIAGTSKTFGDISSSYITVGPSPGNYYTKNMIMSLPINIFGPNSLIKIEAFATGSTNSLTTITYPTTGLDLKITTTVGNTTSTPVDIKSITLQQPT